MSNERETLEALLAKAEELTKQGSAQTVIQAMLPPPTDGERAVHRVEKYFVAMVVLNVCMGGALVLNWITDTNQTHVINAIYMMAPGLQKQIESKEDNAP